jgi:hypothetical protein
VLAFHCRPRHAATPFASLRWKVPMYFPPRFRPAPSRFFLQTPYHRPPPTNLGLEISDFIAAWRKTIVRGHSGSLLVHRGFPGFSRPVQVPHSHGIYQQACLALDLPLFLRTNLPWSSANGRGAEKRSSPCARTTAHRLAEILDETKKRIWFLHAVCQEKVDTGARFIGAPAGKTHVA